MTIRIVTILTLSAMLAAPPAATLDPSRAFLTTAFNLSTAELERIDRGEVISRTLETRNHREVATLGIVRIKTSASRYVERFTDIATFKRTDDILQIGTFSSQPQPSDVAALTIDESELKRLRQCAVDDCDVRLSAEAIERMQ